MRILFALLLVLMFHQTCSADNTVFSKKNMAIEDDVTALDWVANEVSVNDVRIYVPQDTKVYKGEDMIGFEGINIGDPVMVTYYDDETGRHVAVTIIVKYSGGMPV